jgi:hypothetical protein
VISSSHNFLINLWAGVGLNSLGTSATTGPTASAPDDDDDDDDDR